MQEQFMKEMLRYCVELYFSCKSYFWSIVYYLNEYGSKIVVGVMLLLFLEGEQVCELCSQSLG